MNSERAKLLTDRVLQDTENDLADILQAFQESDDPIWHIDRHVLDVDEASAANHEERIAACAAGLGLLRKWQADALAEGLSDPVVSKPYLMIDDEWLEGGPHAPAPHVYICLSKDEEEAAVEHEPNGAKSMALPASLAALLMENESFYRIEGAFEGEPGAWLIKIGHPPHQ